MYRKTKKLFAVALTVAMLLTMTAFSTVASAATGNRLEGADRYATALNIVKTGWSSSEYAVLATGEGYADALAAAPLAKAYSAPILLVDPATDNAALKAELTALGVTKVFIVGGEGVVSKEFADGLTGYTVTRLGGDNRVITSVKVAEAVVSKVGTISEIAVSNGDAYADALSIAPIAANKKAPILLVDQNSVPAEVTAFLAGKTITKTYVVGETGVVSDAVKTALPNAVRLGGSNRYATNLAVLSYFEGLSFANVVLTTGENYPDALAGSAYAAKLNAPIVLIDGTITADTLNYVEGKVTSGSKVIALGGAAVCPQTEVDKLVNYINGLAFKVSGVSVSELTKITVTFTRTLDETSAETPANYTLTNENGSPITVSTAVLNDDKTSVTLTPASYLVDGKNYRLQVKNVLDTNSKAVAAYDELFLADDSTAPTLVSADYTNANKVLTLKFNEMLANGTVNLVKVLNDSNADVTSSVVVGSTDNKTFTINGTNLTADKTYRVVLMGATDLAGNYFATNRVEASFKIAKTEEVKPTVVSVVAKNLNTITVTFSEKLYVPTSNNVGFFKVDNGSECAIVNHADLTAAWYAMPTDSTGTVWDIRVSEANLSGIKKVTLYGFSDMQGNVQDTAYNQFLAFTADTTAPNLVSTSTSGATVSLTFDENVTIPDPTVTVALLTPNSVEKDVNVTLANKVGDNKTVVITFAGADVEKVGTYSITLDSGVITDGANTKAYTTSVSINSASSDSGKPALAASNPITQDADPSIVYVQFTEALGTSALNPSNYLVNGNMVFSSAVFYGDTTKVKLTARPGVFDLDNASYLVAVANVADEAGNVMDAKTSFVALNENVAPTLTAKLTTASTIALTYSETVTDATVEDFEVYVNGSKVALTSYSNGVITLTTALDDINKTVEVKVVGTITDTNGNTLVKVTVPVAK